MFGLPFNTLRFLSPNPAEGFALAIEEMLGFGTSVWEYGPRPGPNSAFGHDHEIDHRQACTPDSPPSI
jgi:hypothetical protein